jgi:integrase
MSKLYNPEIKEKFLMTYDNEQSRKTLNNVFQKSELIESVLEKDLFSFNLDQIGKVISNANPHSALVARSLGRFISQYINWAIPYREGSNLNPLQGIDPDWYDQFVDKTKKIFYSESELNELIENPDMRNDQDKAFLYMCYEGIGGKQFIELRELKISDIYPDENKIYIKQRDEKVDVSSEAIKYLQKAYDQKIYYTYDSETKDYKEKEMLDGFGYIFKNVKAGRTQEGNMVSMAVFYNRLNSIKEQFDLEYLTSNSLKMSGQIALSVELYKQYGKLDYEQFEIIGKKYLSSMIHSGDYHYYNTTLMKEFINPENIKELYGIDIEF